MLNQLVSVVALTLLSQASLAAKMSTCLNEINRECRGSIKLSAAFGQGRSECKMVQAGQRTDSDYSWYNGKVVFFDNNSLISVETPRNSSACTVSRAELAQGINDETVLEGRMFAVAGNGKVYVVTRNNQIHELYNARGLSYTAVSSIKVDQSADTLTLSFNNGTQPAVLGLKTLLNRLNNGVGSKVIAFPSRQ